MLMTTKFAGVRSLLVSVRSSQPFVWHAAKDDQTENVLFPTVDPLGVETPCAVGSTEWPPWFSSLVKEAMETSATLDIPPWSVGAVEW